MKYTQIFAHRNQHNFTHHWAILLVLEIIEITEMLEIACSMVVQLQNAPLHMPQVVRVC